MKKLIVAVAAAGLFSLAACGEKTAGENAAENTAAALENGAENM
jgi:predicted small lipoprotein YifL